MIKLVFCKIFLLVFIFNTYAQTESGDDTMRDVRKKVIDFFVSEGYFSGENVDSLEGELFYSVELIHKHSLRVDSAGVYWIGLFKSHSKEYVMYYEKSNVAFYRVDNEKNMICNIFEFSQRNKFSLQRTFDYILKIIEFLKHKTSNLVN